MSLTDRILQIAELVMLLLCLIATEIYSMRVKNVEKQLMAESSALRYEMGESEERCRRLSYTCVDIVNQIVLQKGAEYGEQGN